MENTNRDEHFMRCALDEARKALAKDEVPIGAVIVAGERIVARSHNLTEMLSDVTAHAEMQAITAAANTIGGKYLSGCELFVTVEPCTMCAGAIGWSQVSRLVYGAKDEKRGYSLIAPRAIHPKTEVKGGVMEEECRSIIQDFFRNKR